jgi:hypothetical protein
LRMESQQLLLCDLPGLDGNETIQQFSRGKEIVEATLGLWVLKVLGRLQKFGWRFEKRGE